MTLLHIEDDSNDVLLMKHACDRAGIQCDLRTAHDGDEAMQYLEGDGRFADRESHPLPGLVLLDLKMPRVNGFEFLAWMRNSAPSRLLPVIVLSSSNNELDIQRAYEAGANSYLVKPVDFHHLVELVRSLHHYWFKLNHVPALESQELSGKQSCAAWPKGI
jgi:CheY-like chemotaxis protein